MKVTVIIDGLEVAMEVAAGDGQAALDLIRTLQSDAQRKQDTTLRSGTAKDAKTPSGTGELNSIQYRTWSYLVENDTPNGVHVSSVARGFGISNAAANSRLLTLEKLGYAKRIHKGYYRAVDKG